MDPASVEYQPAKDALETSKCVALLRETQWPDGTWGRFHTQDTSVKQPFICTEAAIAAALDSGLERDNPILQKAQQIILRYMDGTACWPDPPEKHDNPLAWYVWVPQYSAAVLAQFDRYHPMLEGFWDLWAEAVRVSFQSGTYDRQKEIEILNLLLKCRMKKPVPFHTKPPVLILSATKNLLPESLERQALNHLLHDPAGIYYVYDKAICELQPVHARRFWSWFQAHKLLSRFRLWKELAQDAINWIWAQRSEDGLWDLGSTVARKPFTCFPLSETWRRPENRTIDCSVEILGLLARGLE
jgi:hypothetical protein